MLDTLPIRREGLTEFTYSRMLCPWLCDYRGWSLFLDADMLVLGDIVEVFGMGNLSSDLMVVKNKIRFEWPSLILFNNEACQRVTPDFVEKYPDLLGLGWTDRIGSLPAEWNHCVGYDAPRKDAKLVHFTQGVPYFPETDGTEYVEEWRVELESAVFAEPWETLMGNSIHAPHVRARNAA